MKLGGWAVDGEDAVLSVLFNNCRAKPFVRIRQKTGGEVENSKLGSLLFKLIQEEAALFSSLNELLTNNRRTKWRCRGRGGSGVFLEKGTFH